MKKIISLMLCIVMLTASLPAVFAEEEAYTYPDRIDEAIADDKYIADLCDYHSTPYIPGKYPGVNVEEYEETLYKQKKPIHKYVNFKDEMEKKLKESEEQFGPDEMGISTYDIILCFYRDAYDLPYTFSEADFPELEGKIESVKTYSDLHDRPDLLEDKDYMKRYTPMAYLTMKDQSYDALCDALDKLSERSTTDIMDAEPNYWFRIDLCESETSTPGDVNRDENVDQKDAALLMQYLAGWDVQICNGADVNRDGEVNAKDVNELMKKLSGWN